MGKFYTPEQCLRKADQHWEMAGLAGQENDTLDSHRQAQLAREWTQRAAEGGWEEKSVAA